MQLNEIQKTPYGSFFLLFRSAIREEAPREAARSGQQTAHMQRLKPTILKDSLLSDLHWAFWGPLVNETLPRPPNHPLIYPKYPLLRAIRTLLKGTWGVLVNRKASEARAGLYRGPDRLLVLPSDYPRSWAWLWLQYLPRRQG